MAHASSASAASALPGPTAAPGEAWAVLAKDLAIEFRTRFALTAIGLFALTTLFAVSFAVGPQASPEVQAALLWIILFFAAVSGLMRAFVAEEEGRTADALRLAVSAPGVYLGKLTFNVLLLWALSVLLVPGFVVLMQMVPANVPLLLAVLALGGWGMAAVLTFTAALVSRARARGALGMVIAFPLLAPLFKLGIDGTAAALAGDPGGAAMLPGLIAFAGIMTIVGLLLFEVVWNA